MAPRVFVGIAETALLTRVERQGIVVHDGLKHVASALREPGEVRTGSRVIDGLKVTMTGAQLRHEIELRIQWHHREAQRWSKLLEAPNRSIDDYPGSDDMLEHELRKTRARIEALTFIRDYIALDEVYRLGEFDLRFADLLPEDDLWDCSCGSGDVAHGWSRAATAIREPAR